MDTEHLQRYEYSLEKHNTRGTVNERDFSTRWFNESTPPTVGEKRMKAITVVAPQERKLKFKHPGCELIPYNPMADLL